MKKIFFLSLTLVLFSISCQNKEIKEGPKNNYKYEMSVIQRGDNGEVCIFVLNKENGEVIMRGDKSGSWINQGAPSDGE